MQHEPVTVLLCGGGSRGRSVYGRFALDNPDTARVVAVADPVPERRDAVLSDHNLGPEAGFSDWKRISLEKPLAQVAVIATNDRDHVEPALAFLQAGYHVLLEKPMAPDLDDCRRIVHAAAKARGMSAVCHVLRYTPYFQRLKELLTQGAVGRVISVRHFEPVNYWHFAHSYVRGNWRHSGETSPFILAKCCHDMDILLYLLDEKPVSIHSFGSLTHFRREAAPPDTADRCLDCRLKESCAYSATRFYGDLLKKDQQGWPLGVLIDQFEEASLEKALRHGPYGRCVYRCDNDVCDHQVVNLEFQSGVTASFTTAAFTELPFRETDILGSSGMLRGDGSSILWKNFSDRSETVFQVPAGGNHGGGDEGMLREFFRAVKTGDRTLLTTTPAVSLLSHTMALLAERSRIEGTVIRISD